MSDLDRLLDNYAVPPVPASLARRAAEAAMKQPQEAGRALPRRRDPRGGWKRPLWIGAASFGLAFTSAVAATVVSGGRIEIPVVSQVVEAIPVLDRATRRHEPARQLARAEVPAPTSAAVETPPEATAPGPGEPGWRKAQVVQKLAVAKQRVEQRRAAGLPTPRADRIEAQAKQIVERRQAAGLPVPSIEEVEAGLALREMRRMRMMRMGQRLDPTMLSDAQIARIANRLPPEKRERFLALPPEMQRQLVARTLEKIRERRAMRQAPGETAMPAEPMATPDQEESPAQYHSREGIFGPPR